MDSITLPGSLDSLPAIGQYVMTAAKEAGLDKKAAYRLRLAVDEVATNSIVHGYEEHGLSGMLAVGADIDDQALRIYIEDTGPAYDPRSTPPPDNLDRPLEERNIGGLGVYLTLRGVDQFLYERVGDRNRNIFVINRPGAPTQLVSTDTTAEPSIVYGRLLLVIDEDAIYRTLLSNELKRLSYSVTEAQTGEQALEKIRQQSFDIMLLDATLAEHTTSGARGLASAPASSGGMNTAELLRHLKSDESVRHIPVLILSFSGEAEAETLAHYMELGADDYIRVPTRLEDLSRSRPGDDGRTALFSPALLKARVEAGIERGRLRIQQRQHLERMAKLSTDLHQVILPLGLSVSAERNLNRLLEEILLKAKSLSNADAGTIYHRVDDQLRPVVRYYDSLGLAEGGTTGVPVDEATGVLYDEATRQPNHQTLATHAVLEGRTLNIHNVYALDDEYLNAIKAFDKQHGYRTVSALAVPLQDSQNTVIGLLRLLNAKDPATGQITLFDSYQQLEVESLAAQASIALNNQQLRQREEQLLIVERDVQVGRDMQLKFLPNTLPQPKGWEIVACFHPAREVAGDWYDAFTLPHNRVGIVIADVCDKGVGAALFMSLMRSLIRAYSQQHFSLGWTDVLSSLSQPAAAGTVVTARKRQLPSPGTTALQNAIVLTNNYVAKTHMDMNMFATTFFGVLDPATGQLLYVNGGHMAPILIGPSGVKARLTPTGPAVGMFPDAQFEIQQAQIEPGDILFTYSDGVTDARNPSRKLFTEKRLLALLSESAASAGELQDRVDNQLRAHIDTAPQFDDITMLTVRRIPA
ncbi:MAG: SpoIIE family protein phosphatase [Anaerolineae bacterium]|nr:SpoIIE family protein phosphatase [Anaerolineae bacterium]